MILCRARHEHKVFTGFAYGDPMPHNARFESELGKTIVLYVRCARQWRHKGDHLATEGLRWKRS